MWEQINDMFKILSDVLKNAVLLFALLFIYNNTNIHVNTKKWWEQIAIGLIISIFVLLIMFFPWKVNEGIFFDTRSVLISITGAFFGWIPTTIVVVLSSIYRIIVGGAGVYSGVLTIVGSAAIGLLWSRFRKNKKQIPTFIEYYIFGLAVHIYVLLCFLTIPNPTLMITNTIVPFIGLFPVLTAVLAVSLNHQIKRLGTTEFIRQQQTLLQASIDSPQTIEIFALDHEYRYLVFNEFHRLAMIKHYQRHISKGVNFIDVIRNPLIQDRMKDNINKALQGESVNAVIKLEIDSDKFLEERYQPIFNEAHDIIGVTIFSNDVTERITHEQNVLYVGYHDVLTGLKNRRYYNDQLKRYEKDKSIKVALILADINGLKVVNDAFGHEAGDELLIQVSNLLRKIFASYGHIARIGGDEFVILLENMPQSNAVALVEQSKKEFEQHYIRGMRITVSFGIAMKDSQLTIDEVFKAAEDQMYKSKLFEFTSNRSESIKTILHTLYVKNPREELHSRRVSGYCQKIGEVLNLRQDEINILRNMANLHDIGKIAIDEAILNKTTPLTPEEWVEIKKHPEIGYRLLLSSNEYADIAQDILHHHERYDGTGYPQGLKGKQIPFFSRIIAIADAYDAMTSERPYRHTLKHEEAIEEIKANYGTQFDPEIAKKFIDSFD